MPNRAGLSRPLEQTFHGATPASRISHPKILPKLPVACALCGATPRAHALLFTLAPEEDSCR